MSMSEVELEEESDDDGEDLSTEQQVGVSPHL